MFIAFINGMSSFLNKAFFVLLIFGRSMCESISVFPCPGKCLTVDIIPPIDAPFINAFANFDTMFVLLENERIPITGFSGLSFMSATGAKF